MPLPGEKPPTVEEDDLTELPPMDGEDDEPASTQGVEELDDDPDEHALDPYDDTTAEDDPVADLEIDDKEAGWLDDAGEDETLDVGGVDGIDLMAEDESGLLEDADEPGTGGEELLIADDGSQATLDAGEEGFVAEDEDLREEDLPRLDVGDDAEVDDGTLFEPPDAEEDAALPPWNDRAWRKVEVDAPASSIEAMVGAGRGMLLAAAEGLVTTRVDGPAAKLAAAGLLGGAPVSLALERAVVVVATPRVGVSVSRDGGASFAEANAWRALAPRADADAPLTIALAGAELWALTKSGLLLWSGDFGVTWSAVEARRVGVALVGDGDDAIVVVRDATGLVIGRGRGGRVTWSVHAELASQGVVEVSARGEAIALRLEGRGAFRVENGAWSRLEGSGAATAIAIGRDGALVVALGSDLEGRAWLAEAPVGGPLLIVAEMGDGEERRADEDARIRVVAWDEAAGVAWVAGAFGVAALRR